MNEHLAAAIEDGNQELAEYQAVPVCTREYEKSLDKMHEGDAVERIIKKAIPHIRAMIADEIREEWMIHVMVCGESPATTPEQEGRDYGLAVGLERAIQIAERKQP